MNRKKYFINGLVLAFILSTVILLSLLVVNSKGFKSFTGSSIPQKLSVPAFEPGSDLDELTSKIQLLSFQLETIAANQEQLRLQVKRISEGQDSYSEPKSNEETSGNEINDGMDAKNINAFNGPTLSFSQQRSSQKTNLDSQILYESSASDPLGQATQESIDSLIASSELFKGVEDSAVACSEKICRVNVDISNDTPGYDNDEIDLEVTAALAQNFKNSTMFIEKLPNGTTRRSYYLARGDFEIN